MKIINSVLTLNVTAGESWLQRIGAAFQSALAPGQYPLRFSIVEVSHDSVVVECTLVHFLPDEPYASSLSTIELLAPQKRAFAAAPFAAVQIIPTGIRCEFGGYAGDATPVTNLLASTVDVLITHPNAVNASELNELADNILYVEGKSLDDFLLGHIGLVPTAANRIATFVDPTGSAYLDYVVNTLNAARAVKGISCDTYTILERELGVKIEWSESGCAVGTVLHPEVILRGVELLLAEGAEAIGGVSVIHGVTREMFAKHLAAQIPNPSGGIEAIITHLISKIFRIPTAHAPLPYYQDVKTIGTSNPRASAEFISTPHYYCVLKGLAKAPRLVSVASLLNPPAHAVTTNNVGAIVMPASCLGGLPALAAEYSNIPVIAVRENKTILNVTNDRMGMKNVIEVESYLEAAGLLMAMRKGISLESLRRPIVCARRVGAEPVATAHEHHESHNGNKGVPVAND